MRKILIAVLIPILLPLLFCLTDFALRNLDGNIRTGGFQDGLFYYFYRVLPLIGGLGILWALWKKSPMLAIILAVVVGLASFWYAQFVALLYVCGTGIDCI